MAGATGGDPRKWGLRGKTPRLVWASVLPEVTAKGGPSAEATATWLRGFVGELIRISDLMAACSGGGFYINHLPAELNRPHGATFATPIRGGYGADERGDVAATRGGRPRPPVELEECESIVNDIKDELEATRAGGTAVVATAAAAAAVATASSNLGAAAAGIEGLDGGGGSGMDDIGILRIKVEEVTRRMAAAVRQMREASFHTDVDIERDLRKLADRLAEKEKALEADRSTRERLK